MGYTYKADVEEQKSKLVQALQETLNTEFPGSSDVAQEESAKPKGQPFEGIEVIA